MDITLAQIGDLDGVLALLRANHVSRVPEAERKDGFVTTNCTPEQMAALIEEQKGVTIAKEGDEVLAFALAAPWEFWAQWPFFAYMIERLPDFAFRGEVLSVTNSYQYGPVCIDRRVRGTGVFEQVFYASLASMRERYPIMATFINQVNGRSYAAHTRKVPMTNAGTFQFNGNDYFLMACPTDLGPEGGSVRNAS